MSYYAPFSFGTIMQQNRSRIQLLALPFYAHHWPQKNYYFLFLWVFLTMCTVDMLYQYAPCYCTTFFGNYGFKPTLHGTMVVVALSLRMHIQNWAYICLNMLISCSLWPNASTFYVELQVWCFNRSKHFIISLSFIPIEHRHFL